MQDEERQFGEYILEDVLGTGGMSVVHRARRRCDDKQVAIKVMRSDRCREPGFLSRFRREIEVSKGLAHPYVAKVLDGGLLDDESGHFLVIEYLDGWDLDRALLASPLPLPLCRQVFSHLCEALSYIHSQDLVHRDVKPSNVFLETSGRTVLLDFGLVLALDLTRISRTGERVGTLATMAPEQLRRGPVTQRTDIYALGATMYWALTRRPPFTREQLVRLATGHSIDPPMAATVLRKSLPEHLAEVVHHCLQMDPGRRPASADEVAAAIEAPCPRGARRASTHTPVVPWAPTNSRSRPVRLVVIALALAATAVVFATVWGRLQPQTRPAAASACPDESEGKLRRLRDELIAAGFAAREEDYATLGKMVSSSHVLKTLDLPSSLPSAVVGTYYLARWCRRRGDYARALALYCHLVDRYGLVALAGDDVRLRGELAEIAGDAKNPSALIACYERLMNGTVAGVDDAVVRFELARSLFLRWPETKNENDLWRAEKLLSPFLDEVPSSPPIVEWTNLYYSILRKCDSPAAKDRAMKSVEPLLARTLSVNDRLSILGEAGRVLTAYRGTFGIETNLRRHTEGALALAKRSLRLCGPDRERYRIRLRLGIIACEEKLGNLRRAERLMRKLEETTEGLELNVEYLKRKAAFLNGRMKYAEAAELLRAGLHLELGEEERRDLETAISEQANYRTIFSR